MTISFNKCQKRGFFVKNAKYSNSVRHAGDAWASKENKKKTWWSELLYLAFLTKILSEFWSFLKKTNQKWLKNVNNGLSVEPKIRRLIFPWSPLSDLSLWLWGDIAMEKKISKNQKMYPHRFGCSQNHPKAPKNPIVALFGDFGYS